MGDDVEVVWGMDSTLESTLWRAGDGFYSGIHALASEATLLVHFLNWVAD